MTHLQRVLCALSLFAIAAQGAVINLANLPFTLGIPEPNVEGGKGSEELDFITIRDATFQKVGQIIFYDDAAKTMESDTFLFFNDQNNRASVCFTDCAARANPDFEQKIAETDKLTAKQTIVATDNNTGNPIVLQFTVNSDDETTAVGANSDAVTVENLGVIAPEPSTGCLSLGAALMLAYGYLRPRRSWRRTRS